jgi:2-polyprenyl-3-methyl-5-hydroxy-6-metoxy-1,4-benzoquinol methylase
MNTDIVSYYNDRAKEYEKLYSKPERQEDLKSSATILQEIFADKQVLEIACGTGYWTEKIAATATSIFATDINESVIDIAKKKDFSSKQVSFGIADIYNFTDNNKFESLFGGFIWSHILLQDLDKFVSTVNSLVFPGGTVVFMDNNFVEGSNHPITERDKHGNSFQTRKLENNTTHLVLKNFPTEIFLKQKLKDIGGEFKFFNLTYYWIICYTTQTNNNNE